MRTGTLKVAAGVGTAAVCAVSAALVTSNPKPASAPLKPPTGTAPKPAPQATSGLNIPPSCTPRSGPTLTAAELQVIGQLSQAKTAAGRRAILRSVPADERQQITAFLVSRRAQNVCRSSGAQITPSTGSPPDVGPITNTYVS